MPLKAVGLRIQVFKSISASLTGIECKTLYLKNIIDEKN